MKTNKAIIFLSFILVFVSWSCGAYANGDSPFNGSVPVPPAPLTIGDVKSVIENAVKPISQRLDKLETANKAENKERDEKIAGLQEETGNLKKDTGVLKTENETNKSDINKNSNEISRLDKKLNWVAHQDYTQYSSIFNLLIGIIFIIGGATGLVILFFFIMGRKK